MKLLDLVVNSLLGVFWPADGQGNRAVWFHSQNLNEDGDGKAKGWPWHGRWWLYRRHRVLHRFSWNLWSNLCGFSVKAGAEDGDLEFYIALPPVALWLTLPVPLHRWLSRPFWARWNERTGGHPGSHCYTDFVFFGVRAHGGALWWEILKFDWGWSRKMPRWMEGSFNPMDVFFGRMCRGEAILETRDVVVPMPEGPYRATIRLAECVWKRPRLPWRSARGRYANVDLKVGIPHQGKGENSWDCGEDRLHGLSVKASTIEEAIAATVKSALGSRRRYDGDAMASYPAPGLLG